jgi:hypothetical protein
MALQRNARGTVMKEIKKSGSSCDLCAPLRRVGYTRGGRGLVDG